MSILAVIADAPLRVDIFTIYVHLAFLLASFVGSLLIAITFFKGD